MTLIESHLLGRLSQLPPARVAQLLDFVEFPIARERATAMGIRA